MTEEFIRLPADELLQRFGSGGHKPGSGSAAALNGMLSAALSQTVIALTSGRPGYEDETILELQVDRLEDIRSQLLLDFQRDSEVWHLVITARTAEKAALATGNKELAAKEARGAMKYQREATNLPLSMGWMCIELAEIAVLVFDLGFKSARGDSVVAISSALSAAAGCVGIIYLNLKKFRPGEWARRGLLSADDLNVRVGELQEELAKRQATLRAEVPTATDEQS